MILILYQFSPTKWKNYGKCHLSPQPGSEVFHIDFSKIASLKTQTERLCGFTEEISATLSNKDKQYSATKDRNSYGNFRLHIFVKSGSNALPVFHQEQVCVFSDVLLTMTHRIFPTAEPNPTCSTISIWDTSNQA